MRHVGIAAGLIFLVAAPAAAQDYYQDDGDYAPRSQMDDDWRGADDDWAARSEVLPDYRPYDAYTDGGYDPAAVRSEGEAVEACALAAENQGRSYAVNARVTDIVDVGRDARGWVVDGTVDLRDLHQGGFGREEQFRCAVTFEGLRDVRIAGLDDR